MNFLRLEVVLDHHHIRAVPLRSSKPTAVVSIAEIAQFPRTPFSGTRRQPRHGRAWFSPGPQQVERCLQRPRPYQSQNKKPDRNLRNGHRAGPEISDSSRGAEPSGEGPACCTHFVNWARRLKSQLKSAEKAGPGTAVLTPLGPTVTALLTKAEEWQPMQLSVPNTWVCSVPACSWGPAG